MLINVSIEYMYFTWERAGIEKKKNINGLNLLDLGPFFKPIKTLIVKKLTVLTIGVFKLMYNIPKVDFIFSDDLI